MILGPMIAAAMAGALALPATGMVADRTSVANTPPPAASTNPLVALAGSGFALIGDLLHAVPIVGPLATDIGVGAFCAASFIPVVGDVTKASVNKFDKDQNHGKGCASSTGSASGSLLPGISEPGSIGAISNPTGISTGTSGSSSMPSMSSPSSDHSSTSDHKSEPDHGSASDHSAAADHTSDADHTASADHTAAADHTSDTNHTANADHTTGADHMSDAKHTTGADHMSDAKHTTGADHTSATDHGRTSASAGKQAALVVHFPDGRFQLRQGSGGGKTQTCLVKGTGPSAVSGPCDVAAAWTYQSSTGELHPAADSAVCLVASTKDFETVSVGSCSAATPWTGHWYLSGTRRLFVRDTDEHGSWRFLGARDALLVGGVDQHNIPAVPVWNFPAA